MPTHTADTYRMKNRTALIVLSLCVPIVFIWSAIRPHDYFTWILEVFPAIIGIAVLAATYQHFQILGTQGDVFDTQKDMGMALVGALTSMLLLAKLHDRQLKKIEKQ